MADQDVKLTDGSGLKERVKTVAASVIQRYVHIANPGDIGGTLPPGAATSAKQDAEALLVGAVNETAPASDTASSGLNGRLQRVAQRITSVIALLAGGLPAALSSGGGVKAGIVDALPAGTNNIGDVDVASIAAGANTIGGTMDAGPSWSSSFGVSGARYTSADRSASAASVTDAPTAGQKLVVTDILVSVDTAMRVDFKEETSGTVVASIYLPANGTAQITPRSKLKLATADKKLQVQTSAAGNISVTPWYYSES